MDDKYLPLLTHEIVKHKITGRSEAELETFEIIEEIDFPHDYDYVFPFFIILDDLNEKEKKDPRVQATFRRATCSNTLFL